MKRIITTITDSVTTVHEKAEVRSSSVEEVIVEYDLSEYFERLEIPREAVIHETNTYPGKNTISIRYSVRS